MAFKFRPPEKASTEVPASLEPAGAPKQKATANLFEDRHRHNEGRNFAAKELDEFFLNRQELMDRLRDA